MRSKTCHSIYLLSLFLMGCVSQRIAPIKEVAPFGNHIEMVPLLSGLKGHLWEGTPQYYFHATYPNGVPDDYVKIVGEGAQADFTALRLDGGTIAILQGPGENLNPPGSPPPSPTFKIWRYGPNDYQDLTEKLLPSWTNSYPVEVRRDGRICFITKKGYRVLRFDQTHFVEQVGGGDGEKPRS